MPCYYDESLEDDFENGTNRIRLWKPLLAVTFFYYFFSCGIERIYQPMVRVSKDNCYNVISSDITRYCH